MCGIIFFTAAVKTYNCDTKLCLYVSFRLKESSRLLDVALVIQV